MEMGVASPDLGDPEAPEAGSLPCNRRAQQSGRGGPELHYDFSVGNMHCILTIW